MASHAVKGSIPVLAYPRSDTAAPVSLYLIFKKNRSPAQATLCLQSLLFVDGCDNAQPFILQYDATNIVPGTPRLGPAFIPLPQARLEQLSRGGSPQVRTLSLTLKSVCPVWCPPSSKTRKPQPGKEAPFRQFARLAHSTKLDILFDYNQLHRSYHTIFERLIHHPERLSNFPVGQWYKQQRYECMDWSALDVSSVNVHVDEDATTEDEESPPVYAETSKQPSSVSNPKHATPRERSSVALCSRCEKASSTKESGKVMASPQPPHYCATSGSEVSPSADSTFLPMGFQNAVQQTVKSLLPGMFDLLLPSHLTHLLTATYPALTDEQSKASETLHEPLPALSALGITLSEHVSRKIELELNELMENTLSDAQFLRDQADAEFLDERESARLAFDRIVETRFEDFKEKCEDYTEAELDRVEFKITERAENATIRLKRKRVDLRNEIRELRRYKSDLRKDVTDLMNKKDALVAQNEELRHKNNDSVSLAKGTSPGVPRD